MPKKYFHRRTIFGGWFKLEGKSVMVLNAREDCNIVEEQGSRSFKIELSKETRGWLGAQLKNSKAPDCVSFSWGGSTLLVENQANGEERFLSITQFR